MQLAPDRARKAQYTEVILKGRDDTIPVMPLHAG